MNNYSIHIENGKVVGDSKFYLLADTALSKESDRLLAFTDVLDSDPVHKNECVAEYKCAKYRYAEISLIHSLIYNNNRLRKLRDLEKSYYLMENFDEILKTHSEYFLFYETAPANEKPDFSLYYGVLAFIEKELSDLKEKLQNANDFERIELEERIGGLEFSKVCLDEAWSRRKEVSK
jgi:hypothetical protein